MIVLSILGTILKVILWIILILLLLIIGIILFVIFSPIRYQVSGFPQKELKQSSAAVHITWLLRILGIDISFEDMKLGVKLRITFWKKMIVDPKADEKNEEEDFDEKAAEAYLNDDSDEIFSYDNTPEVHPSTDEAASDNEDSASSERDSTEPEQRVSTDEPKIPPASKAEDIKPVLPRSEPVPAENDPVPAWENVSSNMTYSSSKADEPEKTDEPEKQDKPDKVDELKKTDEPENADASEVEEAAETESEESVDTATKIYNMINAVLEKLEGLSPKIDAAIEKVEEKLDWAEDKLNWAEDKLYEGGDYLSNPHYQKAVKHVFKEIGNILKSLIPQKLYLDLLYSAGNPETTGKILGFSYALPIAQKFAWNLDADFEAEKFYAEGEIRINGKICLYKIVGAVLRLLLDINIWRIVFLLLKLRKQAKANKE